MWFIGYAITEADIAHGARGVRQAEIVGRALPAVVAIVVGVAAALWWVTGFFGARPGAVGAYAFIAAVVEFLYVAVFAFGRRITGA